MLNQLLKFLSFSRCKTLYTFQILHKPTCRQFWRSLCSNLSFPSELQSRCPFPPCSCQWGVTLSYSAQTFPLALCLSEKPSSLCIVLHSLLQNLFYFFQLEPLFHPFQSSVLCLRPLCSFPSSLIALHSSLTSLPTASCNSNWKADFPYSLITQQSLHSIFCHFGTDPNVTSPRSCCWWIVGPGPLAFLVPLLCSTLLERSSHLVILSASISHCTHGTR